MSYIDHTNYATTLKESSSPRGSTPNGNVYFDTASGKIHLIGVNELATVDFGSGAVTNPLNNFDGITARALYNFENARRRVNETLRKFKRGVKGSYRFAGSYNFVNGIKLDSTDRVKLRGSGWIEYAASGDGETSVDRIYHGIISLVDIQTASQPYYALTTATTETALQSATWINFARLGDIDESIQVFGSTANGDTSAGNFDYTKRILTPRVRTWGYNPGETTSTASKISEFSGFSAGYGVGENINVNNTYTLANVYGGAAIAPWSTMTLEKLAAPQVETGFAEADGSFTWVLNNPAGGTVAQCAAFLDALSLQDANINSGSSTGTYNGKKGRVWYVRNASGQVVTSSVDGAGLFIENLSVDEQQKVVMTDNAGNTKTYPFKVNCKMNVGTVAPTDPDAWYQLFYEDGSGTQDFNTATAVTVNDASGNPVKGMVSSAQVSNLISFVYDYDGNNQAGLPAGTDKAMVLLVEGNGVAAAALTRFTMTRSTTVLVSCAPGIDNNA